MKVTPQNFDDLLLDYVYGELDAEAQGAFEAYVAEHPDAQAALAALRDTRAALAPLTADLEPSPIATQRVLAHARDAAERMGQGRGRFYLPRYATALTAVFVGVFGLAVARTVIDTQRDVGAPARAPMSEYAQEAGADLLEDDTALLDETSFGNEVEEMNAFRVDQDAGRGVGATGAVAGEELLRSRMVRDSRVATARSLEPLAEVTTQLGASVSGVSRGRMAQKRALAEDAEPPPRLNRLAYQAPVAVFYDEAKGVVADERQNLARVAPLSKPKRAFADAPAALPAATAPADAVASKDGGLHSAEREGWISGEATLTESGRRVDASDAQWGGGAKSEAAVPLPRAMGQGRLQQQQGLHRDAIQQFQYVVLNAPAKPIAAEAQFETARSLIALDQCPSAIEALQDILDNVPAFPGRDAVLLAQATCFNRIGRYELELERYGMFEAEQPDRAEEVQTRRTLAEFNLQGRLKKAREAGVPATAATE